MPDFQRDLTVSQCALAAVAICDGKISDALRLYRQMRDTMLRLAGSDGAELLYQVDLAEYALWLALLEPAEALGPNDPTLALLSKFVLMERGAAVDSLPGRISALRTTLASEAQRNRGRASRAAVDGWFGQARPIREGLARSHRRGACGASSQEGQAPRLVKPNVR